MNVIKYSRKAHCCHSVKLTFGLRKYKACSINKVGVIEAVARGLGLKAQSLYM